MAAIRIRNTASGFVSRQETRRRRCALDARGASSLFISRTKPKRCQSLLIARHRTVEEHQREILGVRLAELVEAPESRRGCSSIGSAASASWPRREQHAEAFFGEREEDVVLAREIAVDRGRAVFDLFRDLADGDVPIALRDEQLARRIQNRPGNRLPLPLLRSLTPNQPSFYQPGKCKR